LAFIAIVGDERPDFCTISDFRKDYLEAFMELLVFPRASMHGVAY
jgi:hypothetical protein